MVPNEFAYLVLALWPLVSLALFRTQPVGRALIASILIAYLFLPPSPTGFDLPLMPEMNKYSLPALTAFAICFFTYGRKMSLLPDSIVLRVLIITFVFSPMLTALTNGDPVNFGRFWIQSLGIKEGLSMMVSNALLVAPFILAMNFLRSEKDLRDLLLALLIGALVYSIPMLFEVRMSPQLNTWIYGFFQHSFDQMMRGGGFRPIVFLYHGLSVAFFCFTAVLAAFVLYRSESKKRLPALKYLTSGIFLFVVLFLSKSLGSLLFALLLVPLVLFFKPRLQLNIATLMILIVFSYPVLKGNNMVPERAMVERAYEINQDRAASLQFRLIHEAMLLERAAIKPVFGWGTFGRALIHDSTGRITSIPDGRWVITLGAFGWVGYIAEFGLLGFPILLMMLKSRRSDGAFVTPIIGGIALLLSANMIELLPNATLTPLTWLTAGALLGYSQSVVLVRVKQPPRVQSVI